MSLIKHWFVINSKDSYLESLLKGIRVGIVISLIFWTLVFLLATTGCSSVATTEYNTEDKQDQACYATMGGLRGYCDSTEFVEDVFNNTNIYSDETIEICRDTCE